MLIHFTLSHTPKCNSGAHYADNFRHADTCHSPHRIVSNEVLYYANELAKTHLTAKSISITLWPTDKIGQSAVHLTECTAICGQRTGGRQADCIQVLQLGNFRGGLLAHKISMRMRFLINADYDSISDRPIR